mgnify:CR=1 FL=1
MAKTRLNKTSRKSLTDLAESLVASPDTLTKLENAKEIFVTALLEQYDKNMPKAELTIFKKHGLTATTNRMQYCPNFKENEQINRYHLETIQLVKGETYEQVTNLAYGQYPGVVTFSKKGKLYPLMRKYIEATKTHKETLSSTLDNYKNLIKSARTFEDVVEVWSEAESLRESICGCKSLTLVSANTIISIEKDVAKRKKLGKTNA